MMKGKKTHKLSAVLLSLVLSLLACTLRGSQSPTPELFPTETTAASEDPTAVPPTLTPTQVPAPSPTATEAGPCEVTANQDVTIYYRPSFEADVFSTMDAGMTVRIENRTADGWLGFDPGVAQAANTGVFRMRWVHEDSEVEQQGDCAEVPVVVGPQPGLVYLMPMDEVNVYQEPDPNASVLATLNPGDYVEITAQSDLAWSQVDLSQGNVAQDIQGWVRNAVLNINGDYQSLPVVEFGAETREEQLVRAVDEYWGHVSAGNYQTAWGLLTDSFQARNHNSDYHDYLQGYLDMEICWIETENTRVLQSSAETALVYAKVIYYNHEGCQRNAFHFDHHMIYDPDQGWLLEKVTYHE
jgi:hypothetical protein